MFILLPPQPSSASTVRALFVRLRALGHRESWCHQLVRGYFLTSLHPAHLNSHSCFFEAIAAPAQHSLFQRWWLKNTRCCHYPLWPLSVLRYTEFSPLNTSSHRNHASWFQSFHPCRLLSSNAVSQPH